MCEETKASEYNKKGLNCAESIIKAYNVEFGTDIPVSVGSGLGGGNAVGSLCGAVNATNMIISYEKGRQNESETNSAKIYVKDAMNSVTEKYGSHICKDLKRDKVSCKEIIDFSYKNLKETLKKDL